jgi:hypothetical protein
MNKAVAGILAFSASVTELRPDNTSPVIALEPMPERPATNSPLRTGLAVGFELALSAAFLERYAL